MVRPVHSLSEKEKEGIQITSSSGNGGDSGRAREEEDGCMQLGSVVVVLAVHTMYAHGETGGAKKIGDVEYSTVQ